MKNLFKAMLFIGLLFSPIVFSKAEGKKETNAKEAAQASPKESNIPIKPFILSFRISPNPAEYWSSVIIEYVIEPKSDPNLRVDFALNDRPISYNDLYKKIKQF